MKQRIICKGLAVAVIILFLCVGIQPAFAVNTDISDSDDDCDICPKISNIRFDRTVSVKDLLGINDDLKNKSFIREDGFICGILYILFLRYLYSFLLLWYFYKGNPILEILWLRNDILGTFIMIFAKIFDCFWIG